MATTEDYDDDEFWELIGFLRRSRIRTAVMRQLDESSNPLTPTDIAERLGKDMKNISRALSGLSEHGLVECVNPDAANMRMYRVTEQGSTILERVVEIEQEQAAYED